MSDHIEHAAQVIYDELSGKCGDFNMPTEAAEALDAAGLLASPEHDAAVAARALRDAVEWMDENTPDGVMVTRLQVFDFLNDYADRIEREGGASDADT